MKDKNTIKNTANNSDKNDIVINDLSQEVQALSALLIKANHEINNALTVAINNVKSKKPESIEKAEAALWRIADNVAKIDEISHKFVTFKDLLKKTSF